MVAVIIILYNSQNMIIEMVTHYGHRVGRKIPILLL